jgi:nucleotide-binding universal stress UspA family protein
MKILAAFDFSEPSAVALEQARTMAADSGTLALCHVLPIMYDTQPLFPQYHEAAMLQIAQREAELRAALEEHAAALGGAHGVELFVEKGVPYAEICRRAEAWNADRIVVGSHGRGGIARVLLGSVAERVVRHAHCSVHVARPTENSGVVLAATDLSDPSLPAVKAGAEEARRRGARLVVVSAIDWWGGAWTSAVGTPFGMATAMPPAELQNEVRASLDTMLRRALETFGAEGETRVLEGSAAAAIVQAAEDLGAELVIVGTRG